LLTHSKKITNNAKTSERLVTAQEVTRLEAGEKKTVNEVAGRGSWALTEPRKIGGEKLGVRSRSQSEIGNNDHT